MLKHMKSSTMKTKQVADGFFQDCRMLLKEFIDMDSLEFPVFASVWRKNHFSLIFMGRPDDVELTDFTNEAFRIASQFLSSDSFPFQVGAIFLLYALYRNQISDPLLKIRIERYQWTIIDRIRKESILKKYRTLHYVIDYLISNALSFVANQTLRGPIIATMHKSSKNSEKISNLRANYKTDLYDYSVSNNLKELHQLHLKYLDIKKGLGSEVKLNQKTNKGIFDSIITDIDTLLNSAAKSRRKRPRKADMFGENDIGQRRAELKAASFSRKSSDFWGRDVDSDSDSDVDNNFDDGNYRTKKRVCFARAKRIPKSERRVGRPRKKPLPDPPREEDPFDNIDMSFLLNQQQDFFLPPTDDDIGKVSTHKPIRFHYYKVSPKQDDDF